MTTQEDISDLEQEAKDRAEEEGLHFLDVCRLRTKRAQQKSKETTPPNFSNLFTQQRRLTGYNPQTKILTLE